MSPGTEAANLHGRRILLVNFEFPPVQGPGIWRMLGFATHLPAHGWKVSVVCSDRSYWHQRTEPALLERLPPGVVIRRVRGRPAGSILERFLSPGATRFWRERFPDPLFIPAIKLAALAWAEAPRGPFVVVTSGPPHVSHLAGLLLHATRRCVWVADFRDLWVDEGAQAWSGTYQRRLGRLMERAVLRRADAVVTVSPTWAAHLAAKRGRPVTLIRNATDAAGLELPPPERPWPANRRVLLFAGTPQVNNAPDELWQGIRRYLDMPRTPGAPVTHLVFLGLGGALAKRLAALDLLRHLEDLGPQPHARSVALLRGADGALVTIRTSGRPVSLGTIPAKLYQAIALGKPIVLFGDPGGDAESLLAGYRHVFAAGNDPEAIAAALHRFAATPPQEGTLASPADLAGWDRSTATASLDRLASDLLATESRRL